MQRERHEGRKSRKTVPSTALTKLESQAPRLSAVVPLRDPSAVAAAKTITSAQQAAARLVALYDSPGYLDVQRARAALWLLEQIDGDHLTFDSEDREDWCRSICKDAIAASLEAAEQEITGGVHPPLGEPVIHGKHDADCPVCVGLRGPGGRPRVCPVRRTDAWRVLLGPRGDAGRVARFRPTHQRRS